MKTIKVTVHYESKLLKLLFPKWVNGVTVGAHIFYRYKEELVSLITMNHELIHVCQYQDVGIVKFLWTYFVKEFSKSYRKKTSEIEAYAHEYDFEYIKKRWPNYKIEVNKV